MEKLNQQFQVGLKAFIRQRGKLLILREFDSHKNAGKWELPGGRIQQGEERLPLERILLRELAEECGKNFLVTVGGIVQGWRRATHPDVPVFLVGFDCKYSKGPLELSEEHCESAWISLKDVKKYAFADGYLGVIERFFKKI